jgi:basic amino acid/polyamine antiporter, APA family
VNGPDPGFRRELGLVDSVVVVAGGIIGVGIFANPSNVARVLDSPLLIMLAWTIGGAVALAGGFIWGELGSRFPHVGGQYVYLTRFESPRHFRFSFGTRPATLTTGLVNIARALDDLTAQASGR